MLTLDVLATIGILVTFIALTVATADAAGIEQRARRLEHGDPDTAAALRRAQLMTDYARGGFFGIDTMGIVCTPSRRSMYDFSDMPEVVDDPPRSGSERMVGADHVASARSRPARSPSRTPGRVAERPAKVRQ